MKLSTREIKALTTNCQLMIEAAYKDKIEGDEYFKRGFLLACKEYNAMMQNVLAQYEISPNEV